MRNQRNGSQVRKSQIFWTKAGTVIVNTDRVGNPDWHTAAEFTIRRQEEIRRRTIGLGLLKECMPGDGWHSAEQVVIAGEIYTREQAALAELQRGWKGLK